MNVKLLICISHMTYILTCLVYGRYEPKTDQRETAFYRSNVNFFILYCISICIPFYDVPTSNSPMFHVLLAWVIIADLIFTCTHRLLHWRVLYWIHKQRHTNHPSYSTSTFDSHIIEYLFGNVATGLVPMLLIPGSNMTQVLWMFAANINTVSGHHMEGPHMVHHKTLKYNYGQGFYLWDKMFGSYKDKMSDR